MRRRAPAHPRPLLEVHHDSARSALILSASRRLGSRARAESSCASFGGQQVISSSASRASSVSPRTWTETAMPMCSPPQFRRQDRLVREPRGRLLWAEPSDHDLRGRRPVRVRHGPGWRRRPRRPLCVCGDDKIAWREPRRRLLQRSQVITTSADGAWTVYATDLDGDGDADVLSAPTVTTRSPGTRIKAAASLARGR